MGKEEAGVVGGNVQRQGVAVGKAVACEGGGYVIRGWLAADRLGWLAAPRVRQHWCIWELTDELLMAVKS